MGVGLDGARQDLEVRDAPELVAASVEHERLRRLLRFDLGRRHQLGDGRHERPHAQELGRRAAHDGGNLALEDSLAQTTLDLLLAQSSGVEVLLEQRIVALRGRFDELAPVLLDELLHVVRYRDLAALTVGGRHESLEVEKVDDAAEVLFRADGKMEGKRPGRKVVAHGGDRAVEVGILLVQLVDGYDPRLVRPVAVFPGDLCADGELGGRPDHNDRALRRPQATDHLAREIEEARGVEDVDLVAVVLGEADPEIDRDLLLVFLGLEVHGGGGLVGRAHARDGTRGEQHRLGEGRLAVVGSVVSRHPNPHHERPQSGQV